MKIASIILASIALIATFYFVSLKIKTYNFHKTEQKKFIENIK